MKESEKNKALAEEVLLALRERGVRELCLCPGSRNAPFVAILIANPSLFRVLYFFEERSAAFFALGRMRSTGNPVAVITTSGTAAGELLPATMEAYYAGLPLILVTADRPKYYRGSGAPQTAEQVGLFGVYVTQEMDLESSGAGNLSARIKFDLGSGPVHCNVCFDEPLLLSAESPEFSNPYVLPLKELPEVHSLSEAGKQQLKLQICSLNSEQLSKTQAFFKIAKSPLVIVGALSEKSKDAVLELLLRWQFPVYCESLSGLRENPRLRSIQVTVADQIFERAAQAGCFVDGVIRLGGIPTHRLWRDLETKQSHLPVLSLSELPFSGLGRASEVVFGQGEFNGGAESSGSLSQICQRLMSERFAGVSGELSSAASVFVSADRERQKKILSLLRSEPTSEPGIFLALSEHISKDSRIYLGNSLPLREWDLAASFEDRSFHPWASRGLNGIDGQVSTFLGFAQASSENWAVLGDLTALYDLPGPWILSQMRQYSAHLVVINNGGGKIFSRLYPQPEFQNCHALRFSSWAELWGVQYECWERVPSVPILHQSSDQTVQRIVEIRPDDAATARFWKKYAEL